MRFMPARMYVTLMYFHIRHKWINLRNPKTYNEKIQWMKLYHHDPLTRDLSDKYKVREFVKKRIGEPYLVELLGVYQNFDEIDFDGLPDQFVLKCNNDSGSIAICRDKKTFDIDAARAKLEKGLNTNFYYAGREWQYKYIKPLLICEKYIENKPGDLLDYKFFCFDGVPKLVHLNFGRATDLKKNIYDLDWNLLDVKMKYDNDPSVFLDKPENLDEMLDVAARLSAGFPHVRVDLYCVEGKIYFGEMTFTHTGGNSLFQPESFNYKMGGWFTLPPKMTRKEIRALERRMKSDRS
jgi:hypothetical protein